MIMTRIGAVLMISGSFAAGLVAGLGWNELLSPRIPPASAEATKQQQDTKLMALFNNVLARVQLDYVDPVKTRTLINNALNGMLTGLDPHSAYLTEQQWHDLRTETSGQFGGVGLELTENGELLQVVSPIDGSPAAQAGMRPGDLITAVNGKSVEGVTLDDAVGEMRGPPNTRLQLIVRRPGVDMPIALTLIRQIIHIETVKSRLMSDIGVIRITEFSEQTNLGVRAAVKELRAKSEGCLRGFIIDLRNDPGGLLEQAIAVANNFLDGGGIVSTRGRHPEDDQTWSARANDDIAGNLPIVVLTNNGTASAAEIVAGALQDDRRALVLGTQTFGKGSVQTLFPLPGYGAIRLTTARYYTASGRSIQGIGIIPDVEVHETRTPPPHFGPEHEADLRHVLINPDGGKSVPAPPADLPAVAHLIPKLPPSGWPAFNPAKPETDFQLLQGLVLVRAMAAGPQAASR
jgi:carboxyl-terminal processing protease